MANTANKTKAAATPHQASTKKERLPPVAKPTTTSRKGIELVAKVETPKKTETATKPRKTARKKDTVIAISLQAHDAIERLAYQFWARGGYQHGYALQDWLRAEQELRGRAS